MSYSENRLVLNLTTGGTSGAIDVSQRTRMSLQCLYTASLAGTMRFTVKVSNIEGMGNYSDGGDFVNYQRIVSNIVTGVLGDEKVTTYLTLSSSVTSGMIFFPGDPCFKVMKVVAQKINPRIATASDGIVKVWLQSVE